MTIYTLAELKKMKSVQFPEGNQITFWMDFANWRGVPSDRTFYITGDAPEQHKSFNLAADGYGAKENYGNGTIMVKKTDVLALAYQSNVDELVQELRETAGRLINGDVEDGAVSTAMLVAAAEGLERSSERIVDAESMSRLQTDARLRAEANHKNVVETKRITDARLKWALAGLQRIYNESTETQIVEIAGEAFEKATHENPRRALVGTSVKGAE